MPIKQPSSFLTRARISLDPLRLPRLLCDRLELAASSSQARGLTLVSRGLMRHRAFDLSHLAATDRPSALRAQLAAWEPLPLAQYLVSWQGAVAQAFAVEPERLASAAVKNPTWLPETLARQPGQDEVRLVESLDGFEGQAWKAGVLSATRWWAAMPAADEWVLFLRQAGRAAPSAPGGPRPDSPAWIKPSRMPMVPGQLEQSLQGSEKRLVGLLVLVLLGFTAASGRTLWDSFESRRQAQVALADMKAEVAPVLAARDKALAAADQGAALVARLRAPSPLEVLEELVRLLPPAGQIREFDLQGMDVRVLLDLPADVSRSKVITELEAGGWFVQVAETRDGQPRGGLDLQMKLSAAVPPQRGNADAGLQRLNSEGLAPAVRAASATGGRP